MGKHRTWTTGPVVQMNGFFDRTNLVRWRPDEDELEAMWDFNPPKMRQEEFDPLKRWNERLWSVDWKRISSAPEDVFAKAKKVLKKYYQHYERKEAKSIHNGFRSARDNTNLHHILTSFALVDTLNSDMGATEFEDVRYDLDALERAINFVPRYVESRCPW